MTDKDFGLRYHAKVHIDHLKNHDGRVWGVSMGPGYGAGGAVLGSAYTRAHVVRINTPAGQTVFRPGPRQPKAWVQYDAVVVTRRVVEGKVIVELS